MIYVSTGTVAYTEMRKLKHANLAWEAAFELEYEESTVISISHALETLEARLNDTEYPLNDGEKELLELCQLAKSKGADELSVY